MKYFLSESARTFLRTRKKNQNRIHTNNDLQHRICSLHDKYITQFSKLYEESFVQWHSRDKRSTIGECELRANVNWFSREKQQGSSKVSDRYIAGTAEIEAAKKADR